MNVPSGNTTVICREWDADLEAPSFKTAKAASYYTRLLWSNSSLTVLRLHGLLAKGLNHSDANCDAIRVKIYRYVQSPFVIVS